MHRNARQEIQQARRTNGDRDALDLRKQDPAIHGSETRTREIELGMEYYRWQDGSRGRYIPDTTRARWRRGVPSAAGSELGSEDDGEFTSAGPGGTKGYLEFERSEEEAYSLATAYEGEVH